MLDALFAGMMSWSKKGATYYHAQQGLPDKDHAVKWLVVCNWWDLEPLDLLNGSRLYFAVSKWYLHKDFFCRTCGQQVANTYDV